MHLPDQTAPPASSAFEALTVWKSVATVICTFMTWILIVEISFTVKLKSLSIASASTGWTREQGEGISWHVVLNPLLALSSLSGETH